MLFETCKRASLAGNDDRIRWVSSRWSWRSSTKPMRWAGWSHALPWAARRRGAPHRSHRGASRVVFKGETDMVGWGVESWMVVRGDLRVGWWWWLFGSSHIFFDKFTLNKKTFFGGSLATNSMPILRANFIFDSPPPGWSLLDLAPVTRTPSLGNGMGFFPGNVKGNKKLPAPSKGCQFRNHLAPFGRSRYIICFGVELDGERPQKMKGWKKTLVV